MTEDEEFEALEQRLKMAKRDVAADIAEGMKEVPRIRACKHNWVEDNFAQKWRTGKFYIYKCTRCNATSFAELTEEKKP